MTAVIGSKCFLSAPSMKYVQSFSLHCFQRNRRISSVSSFSTTSDTSTFIAGNQKSISNRQQQRLGSRFYEVCELDYSGTKRLRNVHISDILKDSTMHARDFFSLQLTAHDNTKKNDSSAVTKTLLLEHAAALRRRPSPVILPRGKKILVCFGYIRAVISRDHGVIFETHDHLVHVRLLRFFT